MRPSLAKVEQKREREREREKQMSDSFDHLLQYARERDRMLSAYFVCSGFVYMIVVLAIAITLAFSFG